MKWDVSIMEIEYIKGKKFKVTRRLPELNVSETKLFNSKKQAEKQFKKWSK